MRLANPHTATVMALSALAAAVLLAPSALEAQEKHLKIGSLGVMSGPAAGWGGVMCQTAQTRAAGPIRTVSGSPWRAFRP